MPQTRSSQTHGPIGYYVTESDRSIQVGTSHLSARPSRRAMTGSTSTSSSSATSRTPSSAFGPQTELTDVRRDPRPSVDSRVVRFLRLMRRVPQIEKGNLPCFAKTDGFNPQAYSAPSVDWRCTSRYQGIRIEQRQSFRKLPLRGSLELLPSHRQRYEQSSQCHCRAPLILRQNPPRVEGCGQTGRAILPELSNIRPSRPSLITTPIGAVSFVLVVTTTLSHSAHNEESASPRKPNVVT